MRGQALIDAYRDPTEGLNRDIRDHPFGAGLRDNRHGCANSDAEGTEMVRKSSYLTSSGGVALGMPNPSRVGA